MPFVRYTHDRDFGPLLVPVEVHDVSAGDADDVGLRAEPGHGVVVPEIVARDVHGPRRHGVPLGVLERRDEDGDAGEDEGHAEGVPDGQSVLLGDGAVARLKQGSRKITLIDVRWFP